jgi:mono/diheme cytochrome c family protein
MPAFNYLPQTDRRAVVEYVKYLTAETGADGRVVNKFEEAKREGRLPAPIEVPPEPPLTFSSIVTGKELYVSLGCNACHGETGAGDGPSAPTLKDFSGIPVLPRDFNTGAFRGGPTGRDLYLRIACGIPGTPMPPYGDDIVSATNRWALVHFIQSLRRKDAEVNDILAPSDGLIHVSRAQGPLPEDPLAPAWERIDSVRVPLNPLWPESNPLPAVAVRALHDSRKVAILLQWRDEIANGAPVRIDDFQDAAALQFPLKEAIPFLGMGDAENPVNLWQWKAGWQSDADGQRADVQTVYPSMHVDRYPDESLLFITAAAAGNLMATGHPQPVEDANARGFGTLVSQPAASQNVRGKGLWHDGFWNVVFVRDLTSGDSADVNFAVGRATPVSFAIWDGEQRDRNGRKVISNWYQLTFAP